VYAEIARLAAMLYSGQRLTTAVLTLGVEGLGTATLPIPIEQVAGIPSRQPVMPLTPTQKKILVILRDDPRPMTHHAIAMRLGRQDATGKLGKQIRDLLAREMIFSDGDEVTNDTSKFSTAV
jgi:hypothetical protein